MPPMTLRITHEIIPNMIPFAMEYVKGMNVIAQNAEAISAISASKSMFLIEDTISSPTYMSAGVVAKPGIARNTGEKNSATINITADVTAVRPVLPPAATPALDST